MEKFGLFDLFAALAGAFPGDSAKDADPAANGQETMTAQSTDARRAADGQTAPGGTPSNAPAAGVFTAEERRRRAEAALRRHEELSRRIDSRKK